MTVRHGLLSLVILAAYGCSEADLPDVIGLVCSDGDARAETDDGTCIYAVTSLLRWDQARRACAMTGGDLAVADSAAKNEMIFNVAAEAAAAVPETFPDFWIGGNDLQVEGRFVWLDDQSAQTRSDYANWRSGEPNNAGVNGENCMTVESDNEAREWDDRPCDRRYAYVCERPLLE